jgi:hypothetical protein
VGQGAEADGAEGIADEVEEGRHEGTVAAVREDPVRHGRHAVLTHTEPAGGHRHGQGGAGEALV